MPEYVTYLEVTLNGQSGTPAELTRELEHTGWRPVWGKYDFAYKWNGNDWNPDNYWDWVNEVHTTLRKHNIWYSLRTYEAGKEDSPVYWDY